MAYIKHTDKFGETSPNNTHIIMKVYVTHACR